MRIEDLRKLIENDPRVNDTYQTWFNTAKYNWRKKEANYVTEAAALADLLQILSERKLITLN